MKLHNEPGSNGELFAGRYELIKALGEGGMGKVYLAKDTLLDGYLVALKTLRSDLANNEENLKRFFREVQLNRKVNHPNVVRIFDVGKVGELVYFTMEYVEGISLKDKLSRGPLSFEDCKRILHDICSGLAAIHDAGIVHRDLKPGNVMIEAGGAAKIADFGIATTAASDLTSHNELLGCAHYIAPEIWKGKDASPRTDLYALGIILYEMISGEVPFHEGSAADLLRQHLCSPVPEIKNDAMPSYMVRLCNKLLAKSDLERPANCYEIIQKLAGTSSSITHDDFVRPAVLTGTTQVKTLPPLTKLPDYTALKKKTNPDTFKSVGTSVKSSLNATLRSSRSSRPSGDTVGSYASEKKVPGFVTIPISILTVMVVCWAAQKYLVRWDRLLELSVSGVTSVAFVTNLALAFIGISIFFSAPGALVAALRPGYMRDKKLLLMWGELTCFLLGISLSLFCWQIFAATDDILTIFLNNPNKLYNIFRRSSEMLLYVSLFVPRFILQDQSVIYYSCLGFYAIGVFAIFQTQQAGRNIIFTVCMLLLPLFVYMEYYLPIHAKDYVTALTIETVSINLGGLNFLMSKFAFYSGIANWGIILLLVNFLRRILGLSRW